MDRPPAVAGGGEKDAAIVVGIEDYAWLPDIPGARSNAEAWYLYLVKARQVSDKRAVLLTDRDATNTGIDRALDKIARMVQPGGKLWFVFIGHGSYTRDGDGLLVGVDAQQDLASRSLSRRRLLELVGSLGSRTVVVLDACFSGLDQAGLPLVERYFAMPDDVSAGPELPAGVTVLSAGAPDEFAGPLPRASPRRPAFSYLLLGALRGWGDGDGDGVVTASEAVLYSREVLGVLASGREQTPQKAGDDLALTSRLARKERGPDLTKVAVALASRSVTRTTPAPVDAGRKSRPVAAGGGRLTIRCSPPGASAWVDGDELGEVGPGGLAVALASGRHRVQLHLEGHKDKVLQVDVAKDRETEVSVALAPSGEHEGGLDARGAPGVLNVRHL